MKCNHEAGHYVHIKINDQKAKTHKILERTTSIPITSLILNDNSTERFSRVEAKLLRNLFTEMALQVPNNRTTLTITIFELVQVV